MLIVESDSEDRASLRQVLRAGQCVSVTFGSASDALDKLRNIHFSPADPDLDSAPDAADCSRCPDLGDLPRAKRPLKRF